MASLPFLRGVPAEGNYRPVTGPRKPRPLPSRDPIQHRARLLAQLDGILSAARDRLPGSRDPEASREIIAVRPIDASTTLLADQLADRAGDVRVVGTIPETGVLLLDAPGPDLPKLRDKVDEFGKIKTRKLKDGTTTTGLAHERALAPIEELRLAAARDWEGVRLGAALASGALDVSQQHWFEVSCRGGYRNALEATESSRTQIQRQLHRLRHPVAQDFVAPEEVSFFVRLTLTELRGFVATVDCVFGYDLVPADILTWILLEHPPRQEIKGFKLAPPPRDAPAVVVLDSGIAEEHPLLKSAILGASSILPGVDSPADVDGHGTKMAGASLYAGGLGAAVERGTFDASHWIHSVRILVRPRQGTASEANRPYWPKFTSDAITEAEKVDSSARPRAFVLAVTYPLDPLTATTYSQAVDQLAFHDGRGRLLCVSAGNVAPSDLFDATTTYPQGLMLRKIHEPSQGSNVLTIGCFTEKTLLPPDPTYAEAKPVAPVGGISPHSTSGRIDPPWPIKPDVVLEGGNVAVGSGLADPGVESLVTLTTGHDVAMAPLASINATSEASARAAHMAAKIWTENPSLRPATVRGLLVHSASWTPAMRKQFGMPDLLYACGYGVPDLDVARACASDRATVIVEDELPNVSAEERPKKAAPRRPTTPTVEPVDVRKMKVFRMPLPEPSLLAKPDSLVELRVTLSYFPEPSTFRTEVAYGLRLKWDMQGPYETEPEFIERVNDLHRPKGADGKRIKRKYKESFDWLVGPQRRGRGTVQSDRWSGRAASLAGSKLIAVVPVLGWWDRRADTVTRAQPFSLIVSVFAEGIYAEVKTALTLPVTIEV